MCSPYLAPDLFVLFVMRVCVHRGFALILVEKVLFLTEVKKKCGLIVSLGKIEITIPLLACALFRNMIFLLLKRKQKIATKSNPSTAHTRTQRPHTQNWRVPRSFRSLPLPLSAYLDVPPPLTTGRTFVVFLFIVVRSLKSLLKPCPDVNCAGIVRTVAEAFCMLVHFVRGGRNGKRLL